MTAAEAHHREWRYNETVKGCEVDNYRNNIRAAGWTFLEAKFCPYHKTPRHKLRWIGRMLKRSARQLDRREIYRELATK